MNLKGIGAAESAGRKAFTQTAPRPQLRQERHVNWPLDDFNMPNNDFLPVATDFGASTYHNQGAPCHQKFKILIFTINMPLV